MNKLLLITFSLLAIATLTPSSRLHAQFTFDIQSTPDSASIYLNDSLVGVTPAIIKFRWVNVPDTGIVFRAQKPGYKTGTIAIKTKPRNIRVSEHFKLDPIKVHYKLDSSSALVDFDKLLITFPTGKTIGEQYVAKSVVSKLNWDGFSRIGTEEYALRAYDVLGNMGFYTPQSQSHQLFSNEKRTAKAPRFIIGCQVLDLRIDLHRKSSYSSTVEVSSRIDAEWQVLDRSTNAVVDKQTRVTKFDRSYIDDWDTRLMPDLFAAGLEDYLGTGKLYDLVVQAGGSSVFSVTRSSMASIKPAILLPSVKPSNFASITEMVQNTTDGCVTITTDVGHGSGVLISSDGSILTAAHVIAGVNRVSVIFSNGIELPATVETMDELYDVALLKVTGSRFRAIPTGMGLEMKLGEELVTIGTPSDIELGQSVSKGILSGKRKIEEIVYLQTDLSVSPGNSGGPLLDAHGNIVGLVQRKLIGKGVEGVSFALPIETVLQQLNIKFE